MHVCAYVPIEIYILTNICTYLSWPHMKMPHQIHLVLNFILISMYISMYLFLLLLFHRLHIHRPLCRQIAMPLSRRSAKWFNSASQIQLRFRRLPERPVSARFCAVQREWSARASKMSTRWQLVWTGTQVPQLWGSVANQNGGHDDAGIIWRVHTTTSTTPTQHASLLATHV